MSVCFECVCVCVCVCVRACVRARACVCVFLSVFDDFYDFLAYPTVNGLKTLGVNDAPVFELENRTTDHATIRGIKQPRSNS
jgi:hypothetical protein